MTTPTGILLGNAVASGDFGDDSPLANIWETILAIEAEAAPLDGLRKAAQAVVDSALLTDFGPDERFWTVHSAALKALRAALRDEGETT